MLPDESPPTLNLSLNSPNMENSRDSRHLLNELNTVLGMSSPSPPNTPPSLKKAYPSTTGTPSTVATSASSETPAMIAVPFPASVNSSTDDESPTVESFLVAKLQQELSETKKQLFELQQQARPAANEGMKVLRSSQEVQAPPPVSEVVCNDDATVQTRLEESEKRVEFLACKLRDSTNMTRKLLKSLKTIQHRYHELERLQSLEEVDVDSLVHSAQWLILGFLAAVMSLYYSHVDLFAVAMVFAWLFGSA